MIDWSYNLLTEAERTLLRRLSVFAGSWVLEAAEQVCSLELEECLPLCPEDVFDLLAGLVDKSLVLPAQEGKVALRFRMLETIRQYAHEKLVDEKEAAACAPATWYFMGWRKNWDPRSQPWAIQTRTRARADNLRLALEWALQTDLEAELRISTALHWFWQIREHFLEAIDWLERGLEAENKLFAGASKELDLSVRAKALASLGYHHWIKSFVSSDKANPMDEAQTF
jgi:non-specific serine/threonine protein kinase